MFYCSNGSLPQLIRQANVFSPAARRASGVLRFYVQSDSVALWQTPLTVDVITRADRT